MEKQIKNMIQELFGEIAKDIEEVVYYLSYSNKSKRNIPGYEPDDIAQELVIKIHKEFTKGFPTFDRSKKIKPYITAMCKFHLINLWHKQQRSNDAYDKCDICELTDWD